MTTKPYRVGELTLVEDDLAPTNWIVESLRAFPESVGSLLPDNFSAFARVLHPAYREDDAAARPAPTEVSWAEVATARARRMHPEVQFVSLVGYARLQENEDPWLWDTAPEEGNLPADLAAKLVSGLTQHTTTPGKCFFAVWDGWGDLPVRSMNPPTFHLPGRDYLLFTGPIWAATQSFGSALGGHQSANLWWPSDKTWCVSTEIDLNSTYVGGSRKCIAELLMITGLEILRVKPEHGIGVGSDRINPPPVP